MIQDLFAAVSAHTMEKITPHFAQDYVYEDVTLGFVTRGREALRADYSGFFAAVPDFKLEALPT